MRGTCKKEADCDFYHFKTCKNYASGTCKHGNTCNFLHRNCDVADKPKAKAKGTLCRLKVPSLYMFKPTAVPSPCTAEAEAAEDSDVEEYNDIMRQHLTEMNILMS